MKKQFQLVGLIAGLALLSGCAGNGRPAWFGNQESQAVQLENAVRFDPFPDQDLGPNISETLPPGFEHQVAEPKRARWWQRMMPNCQ